jgi:ABC-type branched-subunit amino acid transport system permease subunit
MHTRSIRPHSPYEIACWACVIGWLKFVHFVTGGPFGLHGFGRFAGLPSEDLQQHGVIYLIVLGFAAAGIAAMLFFCEESNAGKAFRAIRKDPLLAQSQGINVSASKLCASGRSIPALTVPAYARASTAR